MMIIRPTAQQAFYLAAAVWLACGCGTASAQNAVLSGSVVDAETGKPLPGVNVFLNHTMIGTATDNRGVFKIGQVPPGSYELVASMLGYAPGTEQLEVVPEMTAYGVAFRLSPAVLRMSEIEITARRPRGWQRDFKRFEELFLGTGRNARQSNILNPYALDFETKDGIFLAKASSPLEIENRALGYRITFVLTDFRMDWNTNLLHTQGPFYFDELKAANSAQAARWIQNRERTYRGSLEHILSSLIRGNTLAQRISVKLDDRKDAPYSPEKASLKSIEGLGFVENTERPYLFKLSFPHYLYVSYRDELSWIEMNRAAATIHESGYVYAPAGISGSLTVHGALSRRRVSDLLPLAQTSPPSKRRSRR